jgi:hypothetical protein
MVRFGKESYDLHKVFRTRKIDHLLKVSFNLIFLRKINLTED